MITGSAGFLAQHLIPEAKKGKWFVIGVDKRPQRIKADEFIQTDVFDLNYRDLMDVEAVVHLAWRTNIYDCIQHPEESTKENINMTLHLLEVCKMAKVKKFIFPSTASLYSYNKIPWTEDMKLEPIEHYSWQKLSCEYLCQMYANYFNVPSVILRFFQIYGEYQRKDTVISVFKEKLKKKEELTIFKPKDKNLDSPQRDFLYAGDLSKAIMLAIKSKNTGKGEVINICTNKLTSILDIVKTMGAKYKIVSGRDYDVDVHLGDNKKARILLGWQVETEILKWLEKYGK